MLLAAAAKSPHIFWVWPFVAILLAIAILPLLRKTHHWWEHNKNKLIVSLILAAATLLYYQFRGYGVAVHHEESSGEAAQVESSHGEPSHAGGPAPSEG
ncbi:MAG: hypothetical protein D6744_15875, partial [Planctomycetota bacterium]